MTKEQAYKNLSLAEDADSETIRIRFAARYSLSDEAYDRTLTEGMKTVHERHLRELETAYKVLTASPVINDMGALLSLSKGYITEGGDTIGDEQLSSEEALAFFALYPHDKPLQAQERYLQYKRELEEGINQAGLESSKEPFRQEMIRADACFEVAVSCLMANQIQRSKPFSEEGAGKATDEGEDTAEPFAESMHAAESEVSVTPAVKTIKSSWLLPLAAMTLIALGAVIGLWWADRDEAIPQQHAEVDAVHEDTRGHRRGEDPATEETATRPSDDATVQPVVRAEMEGGEPKDSPESTFKREIGVLAVELRTLAKLLEDVSDYRLSEQSTPNTWYLAPNDSTKWSFVVPVSNVDNVNAAGTMQAKHGRTFKRLHLHGKPSDVTNVPGFLKTTASPTQRDALMEELQRLGVRKDTGKSPVKLSTAVGDSTDKEQP